jgi:hypothetical protein
MLKKIFLILFLFGIQNNLIYAGGCKINSNYKINGGKWEGGIVASTYVYTIYINPLDTVYMYAEDCDSGPFLGSEWHYNGLPLAGMNDNYFKTDSAGIYSISNTIFGGNSVVFNIIIAASCPVINAGPDQVLCNTVSNIALAGSRSYFSNILWTGGSGSFSPDANTLDAHYIPSSSDIALGMAKLCLRADGTCASVSDSINIMLISPITVNAGVDQTICKTGDLSLNGIVGANASGGVWSTTGSGIFTPDNTDLNATYTPSITDQASGPLTFTLIGVGNGSCTQTDQFIVTLTTCTTTGTSKFLSAESITIYPNPNDGKISIDFSEVAGIIRLDILNILGEKLKTFQTNETKSKMILNIEDLSSGIYFVGLVNDQGQQLMKKIVKR